MKQKIFKTALLSLAFTSLYSYGNVSMASAQAPAAGQAKQEEGQELDKAYLAIVTESKPDVGATLKIVMINKKLQGKPERKDETVYLDKSRIKSIPGGEVKVGEHYKFQMLSPEPLTNYFSPVAKGKPGLRIIVGIPELVTDYKNMKVPADNAPKAKL